MNGLPRALPDKLNHQRYVAGDLVGLVVCLIVSDRWCAFSSTTHVCDENIKPLFCEIAAETFARLSVENFTVLNSAVNHQHWRTVVIVMNVP